MLLNNIVMTSGVPQNITPVQLILQVITVAMSLGYFLQKLPKLKLFMFVASEMPTNLDPYYKPE